MCNQPIEREERCELSCSCLAETLEKIIKLQNRKEQLQDLEGCDKPFLGPCPSVACFNTRPIQFYTCPDNNLWTFPFLLNGTSGVSNLFRVESIDGCCVTCRLLTANPNTSQPDVPYVATDSFCTINLNCVGAMKCFQDTFVPCI